MTPEELRDVLSEYTTDDFSEKMLNDLYKIARDGQLALAQANSVTSKQLWRINKEMESKDLGLDWLSELVNREVDDTSKLTKKEATKVISELNK
ncbi:hypothetical protein RND61_14925 [Streptomyces sp. TRM76323]|uniref:Uncharacterized protein n=1 Tax=Streptomyces tamarix TaxID=3078565 RepID=A0ABU3QKS4_9ACTN|nr:hypothetical protein [Streptomyces tamarix]MDT9683356.1 hypothetical protein [Streptomyces tamarix]